MPLAPTDLLLPDSELQALLAATANSGVADAVTRAATEAAGVVDDYTAKYTLSTARRDRLERAICIAALYTQAGSPVPDQHQRAYDAAMAELRDIRDGKFSDLPPAAEAPVSAMTGAWGSATRFTAR
jgi:phage gp36-like protein